MARKRQDEQGHKDTGVAVGAFVQAQALTPKMNENGVREGIISHIDPELQFMSIAEVFVEGGCKFHICKVTGAKVKKVEDLPEDLRNSIETSREWLKTYIH